ncbi:uncharacterized protein [Rutidosis leptorrhynchoides]|uniref:uncharacterized protein n=1 Tax=Rutidosis leptorrhynchoides TaxID=125765 RepID=UPI003A9A0307
MLLNKHMSFSCWLVNSHNKMKVVQLQGRDQLLLFDNPFMTLVVAVITLLKTAAPELPNRVHQQWKSASISMNLLKWYIANLPLVDLESETEKEIQLRLQP